MKCRKSSIIVAIVLAAAKRDGHRQGRHHLQRQTWKAADRRGALQGQHLLRPQNQKLQLSEGEHLQEHLSSQRTQDVLLRRKGQEAQKEFQIHRLEPRKQISALHLCSRDGRQKIPL